MFPHPVAQNIRHYLSGIQILVVCIRIPQPFRRERLSVDDLQHMVADLRVEHVFEQGLLQRRNSIHSFRLRIFPCRDVGEHVADLRLHLVRIEVPDHHYGLQVRPVPLVVEIQYLVRLESVYDLQRTYDTSLRMFRTFVHQLVLLRAHPQARFVFSAPFFTYHSPFRIKGLRLAGYVARPVVQYHQHRVHERFAYKRH